MPPNFSVSIKYKNKLINGIKKKNHCTRSSDFVVLAPSPSDNPCGKEKMKVKIKEDVTSWLLSTEENLSIQRGVPYGDGVE